MKKRYKAYGILAYCPETGEYVGETERSFSMDLSNERTRIYSEWEILFFMNDCSEEEKRLKKEQFLRKLNKSAERFAKYLSKKLKRKFIPILFRAGSKNAPVSINWDRYYKMSSDKFERRNPMFQIKGESN